MQYVIQVLTSVLPKINVDSTALGHGGPAVKVWGVSEQDGVQWRD